MGVSVTNTYSLRQYYGQYKNLVIKANRTDENTKRLSFADSSAIKKAAKKLADYDYEDSSDSELEEKLKAFVDTYNYTLESGDKTSLEDSTVKSTLKKMRELTDKYSDKFESLGFNIDSKGYISMSSSNVKNISHEKFSTLFGKDSAYMSELTKHARRIANHVDLFA